MRIGLVLPAPPSYSETFFQNKINGLIQDGHKVSLFVQNRTKLKDIPCEIFYAPNLSGNIGSRSFNSLKALFKLLLFSFKATYRFWKFEKNNGASFNMVLKRTIINSHILNQKLDWLHFGFATMGIERELVGKAIGAKVAVSFRGYDISIYPLQHENCYDKLWRNINKVHTISNDLLLEAYYLGLPRNIEAVKITPAIDVKNFDILKRNFFENNMIRILTVGRLHWKKGLEYTLEALFRVKKNGYSIQYTIAGEGIEYERLVYSAFQLGLKEEVKFMGRVQHYEIPKLMATHDVYIQYSVQEGFCNAVLEAQAAGMLCIVSDAEGLSENVLHEKTGWVIQKRQPELLAKQIELVYKLSPSELEKIRINAVTRVQQEFNLEIQRQEFNKFYAG